VLVANAVNSDNCSTRVGEWWKDIRQYLLSSTWVELFLVNFSASIDLANFWNCRAAPPRVVIETIHSSFFIPVPFLPVRMIVP
jgi:hypothetical protein